MCNFNLFTLSFNNNEELYQIIYTYEGDKEVSVSQKNAIVRLSITTELIKTRITSWGNQYESDQQQVGTDQYDISLRASNLFQQALEPLIKKTRGERIYGDRAAVV